MTPRNPATASKPAQRILIAEDAVDLREALSEIFLDHDYLVKAACDGYEAIEMFPEFDPDLVILDMRMPMMNGTDTCSVLRRKSNVPIIMFTSNDDVEDVQGAIAKGATDFVLKTTGVAELTERVASHLGNRQNQLRIVNPKIIDKHRSTYAPDQIKTTTLIVDPDLFCRNLSKSVITDLHQDYIEVETAAEAILAVEQHNPDIMLTEWMLPDMNVFNLLSELKRSQHNRPVLKLMMTHRLSPNIVRKSHLAGINGILDKPLDGAEVTAMITDFVKQAALNLTHRSLKAA